MSRNPYGELMIFFRRLNLFEKDTLNKFAQLDKMSFGEGVT